MRRGAITIAVLASVLGACSDDGSDADPSASQPETVALEDIELSALDVNTTAIGQVGDEVVIADGLSGGLDGHLKLWVAPLDGSTGARELDLDDVGPLANVGFVAVDDRIVLAGMECPDPWVDPGTNEDPADGEYCGSLVHTLLLIDPEDGDVEELRRVDGRHWELFGGGEQAIMQQHGEPLPYGEGVVLRVGSEGTIEELPVLPHPLNAGNPEVVCPIGDDLITAMSWRPQQRSGPAGEVPLEDAYMFTELRDGEWREVALPDHPATVASANVEMCTDDGVLIRASGPPYDRGHSTAWQLVLDATTDPWQWRDVTEADLPPTPSYQVFRPDLGDAVSIDDEGGRVVVGPVSTLGLTTLATDPPPTTSS